MQNDIRDINDPFLHFPHYPRRRRVFTSVCLSVFPHDKTDAARISKLDIEIVHDESWKPIYFGVRKSGSWVTKTLPAWVFVLLWVLASSSFPRRRFCLCTNSLGRIPSDLKFSAARLSNETTHLAHFAGPQKRFSGAVRSALAESPARRIIRRCLEALRRRLWPTFDDVITNCRLVRQILMT